MARNFFGSDTLGGRAAAAGSIWEARQRQRQEVVDDFETVDDPRDVPVGRPGGEGITPTQGFLDEQLPREAAARIDPQFPQQDVGASDVRQRGQGFDFAPRENVVRQRAAFEIEDQTPLEQVDPSEDLQQTESGFGLTQPRQRDVAAREIDPQFPAVDIGREDVTQTEEGFGLDPFGQRRVAANQFEQETPLEQVDPETDLEQTEQGFGLAAPAERRVAADQLENDTPLEQVDPQDDITRTDDGFELRDRVIENNRSLFL